MGRRRALSLLEDPVIGLFLRLCPSAILGMAVSGIYSFVDGIYIGQIVGPGGLAGVTVAFPLITLSQGVSALIGIGSASAYSRFLGSKDMERAGHVFTQALVLNLVLCALFAAALLPLLPACLSFLGASGEALEQGRAYAAIVLGGTILGSLQSSFNMLIRAEGRMKTAMAIISASALLNIGLDALLMLALPWGVRGAAVATLISQAAGAILSLVHFLRGRASAPLRLSLGRESPRAMLDILAVGLSGLALPSLTLVQTSIVLRVVNLMGHAAEIPALGAAMRILQLLLIPVWGAGQALQPVAGTNFGAGRHTRVLRAWQVFTLFSSLIAIALWIPAMAFPSRLLNIFMANPASIGSAAGYLRLYLISYPGYGLMLMTLTLLQATGKALAAALLAAGKFIIAFVPALLVLTPLMGIRGVFLAAPAADFVVILAGSILLALDFPGRRPGKASALRASA